MELCRSLLELGSLEATDGEGIELLGPWKLVVVLRWKRFIHCGQANKPVAPLFLRSRRSSESGFVDRQNHLGVSGFFQRRSGLSGVQGHPASAEESTEGKARMLWAWFLACVTGLAWCEQGSAIRLESGERRQVVLRFLGKTDRPSY